MATQNALRLAQSNLASKRLIQDSSRYKCQKCLQIGHFTYQCTNKRTYSSRVTRSKLLDDKIEENIIEKSKLTQGGDNIQVEPITKKPKLANKSVVRVPKADDLSDLSSQTSKETDAESSDDSSDSTTTSSSSDKSVNDASNTNKPRKIGKEIGKGKDEQKVQIST